MFKVSKGNSKLGTIYNINLPAITTCIKDAPCASTCYACKGTYRFKAVRECYAENLRIVQDDLGRAFHDILEQLPYNKTAHCRVHSSGDFIDWSYLDMICDVARERDNIHFLAFTKQYDLVSAYDELVGIPSNMRIIFSHWEGLEMENPWNYPVAIVAEKSDILIKDSAVHCSGKCDECFKCWYLSPRQQVVFNQH